MCSNIALLMHVSCRFVLCLGHACLIFCAWLSPGPQQVLCEVYSTLPVKCETHVLLSLILYKMVDGASEVS